MRIDQLSLTMKTRLFPIIGCPMSQSSAAFAYNPLFAANGIDEIMWPVEVPPERLGDFMAAARTLGIRHFTLTMPLKSKIIPHLDEVDGDSRLFNSVNIVRFDEQGKTHGAGMDGKGNMAALRNAGVRVAGMRTVIIGAGSIVGAIVMQLARAGAKEVVLLNRSAERGRQVVALLRGHADIPITCRPLTGADLADAVRGCDLLMQSTPLGMVGVNENFENLDFIDLLPQGAVVMENIVNPPRTAFAQRAEARGLKVVYGVDMMLGQLGEIFNFCYGYHPRPEHLQAAKAGIYGFFGLPL